MIPIGHKHCPVVKNYRLFDSCDMSNRKTVSRYKYVRMRPQDIVDTLAPFIHEFVDFPEIFLRSMSSKIMYKEISDKNRDKLSLFKTRM